MGPGQKTFRYSLRFYSLLFRPGASSLPGRPHAGVSPGSSPAHGGAWPQRKRKTPLRRSAWPIRAWPLRYPLRIGCCVWRPGWARFSWLFRRFFVAFSWPPCLEKQCSGLFRYFFVVFSWLLRGPCFGQILRVFALEQSSDLGCSLNLSSIFLDLSSIFPRTSPIFPDLSTLRAPSIFLYLPRSSSIFPQSFLDLLGYFLRGGAP